MLMCPRKDFASERHGMLIAFVALLKFWLAFRDKANYLDGGSPCVLNQGTVLNLYVQPRKLLPHLRVNVVLVHVMYTAIACVFGLLDVIVLIEVVSTLMLEASTMKFVSKYFKIPHVFEDQATPCYVIHTGKLHSRQSEKLVKNRTLPFMTLCYRDARVTCSVA